MWFLGLPSFQSRPQRRVVVATGALQRTHFMLLKYGQGFIGTSWWRLFQEWNTRLIKIIHPNHHQRHVFRPYETTLCELRQTPGLICYQCDIVATCIRINNEWKTIPVAECGEGMFCNVRQGGCSDLAGESMPLTCAADKWAAGRYIPLMSLRVVHCHGFNWNRSNILFQGHATVSVI